ncbi:Ggdef family protein [Vibrio crassostreae]|uniref:Ggdef family protein n=1 Tax=Vibrio crassostreae TaxID=246167 RepID=A0A822MYU4_9VIBR|nr:MULTISPECIES: hemerythrin family protein [Vibrio]MDH5950911.1 hemerythrin family protein [Vibrio crassostreae]TCN12562.1 hemerythrin [Vibrio crassostreae]TCU11530.1 hemerythrin [Vibrio crassostreae]TKE84863.1 bacteriohemerythrin [Vibrio sp. F12]CAK1857597.1 Ggdef family protein [Vibrio crassostreae]
MNFFKWSEDFEVGIDSIDHQHKKLVELINRYGEEIKENEIKEIQKTLSDLSNYSIYHFAEEEGIMARSGIPEEHIKKHRCEHENFISSIGSIVDSSSRLNESQLSQLFDFLVNWLATHILCCDKRMVKQISLIKDGLEPNSDFFDEEFEYNKAIDILQSSLF